MDKNLKQIIENMRALSGSALGTLQSLDDHCAELEAALCATDEDRFNPLAQIETATQARRQAKERKSHGKHEQVRKCGLQQD